MLSEERSNILGYLKTELENDKITLKIDVRPVKEEEMKAQEEAERLAKEEADKKAAEDQAEGEGNEDIDQE